MFNLLIDSLNLYYQCSTANRGEVRLGPVATFLVPAPFLAFSLASVGFVSVSSSPVDA